MRFWLFLAVSLSIFMYSSLKVAMAELRINHGAITSCQFAGEKHCIITVEQPILILFQVGENIVAERTVSDSEVPGVRVYVSGRYFNTTRLLDKMKIEIQPGDMRCAQLKTVEARCFKSNGEKEMHILLPSGTDFDVLTMIFGNRIPAVLVVPVTPVNNVKQ